MLSRLTVVAIAGTAVTALVTAVGAYSQTARGLETSGVTAVLATAVKTRGADDNAIARNAKALLEKGRAVFRYETFGDEAWWTDTIQLHKAIEGVSPATALSVGLKVDIDAIPKNIQNAMARGAVDLNDPAVTLALLKLDAVVGVKATLSDSGNSIKSMGITCALCHSTVDDSFASGIGHRLDG